MSKSNTYKLLYLSIAILSIACAFLVYKTAVLSEQIKETEAVSSDKMASNENNDIITRADSLLLQGNYEAALDQYNELSNSPFLDKEFRKTVALKLLNMHKEVYQAKTKNTQSGENSLITSRAEETPTSKTVDSLAFALEKAEMQLNSVRKQMQEKSFGQYITFKSTKGNRLHYVGGVKNKKANGFGIAILDSGSRYEGEWQNNQRHGQGTFYWIDGEHYEGQYKNDLRSGQGTYYWTNGEKYIGSWDDDKRNGKGKFYDEKGDVLTSGIWKDDVLVEEDK